jgi:hypothetical protein
MFGLFKKQSNMDNKRMTVLLKDQNGGPYALVALSRQVVKEATYITTTGILQLVLETTRMQGSTQMQWIQMEKNAKRMPDGRIMGEPINSFKQDPVTEMVGEHNVLNIADEPTIRKVWDWLECDVNADHIFKLREEQLQLIKEFKEQKLKEQQENLKNKEAELAAGEGAQEHAAQQDLIDNIKKNGVPAEDMEADMKKAPLRAVPKESEEEAIRIK